MIVDNSEIKIYISYLIWTNYRLWQKFLSSREQWMDRQRRERREYLETPEHFCCCEASSLSIRYVFQCWNYCLKYRVYYWLKSEIHLINKRSSEPLSLVEAWGQKTDLLAPRSLGIAASIKYSKYVMNTSLVVYHSQ